MLERESKWIDCQCKFVRKIANTLQIRTYIGPRTNDTIDMLPPEDPEAILSDYDIP